MSLREEILDVSKELLLKHGFSKMSMRKIAKKANVTATSIYLHFKNKDDLLLALVEESIAKLNLVLRNSLDESVSPVAQLESLADAYVDYALENPQEYEIIYMVRPEEMPKYPREKFQQVRQIYELLAGIIRKGQEQQLFDVEDPLVSAYTLWAQIHGVVSVILGKRLDTRIPNERFLSLAKDHIIQGFIIQKTPA
ncbi:TetR/AcrR family transcriptional regulator [Rhodohalobacter halophilus]|uniref:TetR/AcrR family transcriptional regulator n=1 Tax=Rhodohalobacter halophilus TaxID=1812810 RepID=UPI00083FB01D|nr:TetR/AcrR family transcriptional regulator [Rhodohalobacter halophilus]